MGIFSLTCAFVLGVLIHLTEPWPVFAAGTDLNERTGKMDVSLTFDPLVIDRRILPAVSPQTKSEFQCGKRSINRIIGGSEAADGEWCWQAKLHIWKWPYVYLCGGSIISDRYILTAAHCVYRARVQDVTVYLGAHNRAIGDEKLRLKAERVIRHPEYSPRTFINDVALIKVNNKIKFTNGLCSVCLPNENTPIGEGVAATITGWGNTSPYNLMYPTVLMKAIVNIVSQENCSAAYKKSIPTSQICAAAPGKDSCQGDSGGPMVVESDGTWQLIGITSWGKGCANPKYPGVYTNVVMFVPWIQSNSQDCGQQCS